MASDAKPPIENQNGNCLLQILLSGNFFLIILYRKAQNYHSCFFLKNERSVIASSSGSAPVW